MEQIRERKMSTYVLSFLVNVGIGLAAGLVIGIFESIATSGDALVETMLVLPLTCAAVFAVVSMNIYVLYFYYTLSLDVNEVCKGDGVENTSFPLMIVLSLLTLGVYNLYWLYKIGQRLRANAPRYGYKMLVGGADIVVLHICSFGFVSAWELINNMNRFAKVYNQGGAKVAGGVR